MTINHLNSKSEIRNSKSNKGFSIVELVFAMCFLTLIILGVVNLQSGNLAMINRQNNQIQANFYANQGVQILKSLGYDATLFACSGDSCKKKFDFSSDKYVLFNQAETDELIEPIYKRHVEIYPSGLKEAYKATVFVDWTDSTGEHKVSANTIIF
jgi:hypothetical protein